MKIGIIGSRGFIGSNLNLYLKNFSNYKVYCFSSYSTYKKNWIRQVSMEINKFKPNIILNCAADQNSNDNEDAIINLLNSNLKANILFLNRAVKYKNFKGYISFGSKWEYNEDGVFSPLNFYAATKHANDSFLKYFALKKKITTISLKIFETYGKNDKRKRILNLLLNNYKKGRISKITPGNQFLDYVNILEICELIKLICDDIFKKKLKGFKTYTVSSKKPVKLKLLIRELQYILNKNLNVKIGAIKYRKNEAMKPIKKINNYRGWKPKLNLIKELKKIFDEK